MPAEQLAYNYFLGLTAGDGRRTFESLEARRKVAIYLNRTGIAPGCSIFGGQGWWEGVAEDMLLIFISGITPRDHHRFLEWLRREFSQRFIGYQLAAPLCFHGSEDPPLQAA